MNTHFDVGQSWAVLSPVEQSIKQKIENAGKPLKEWGVNINYGIKTGLNEAFIISGAKKDELVSADPKSAEIIRPILRGRDIKRYAYNFSNTWLINSHNGIKEKNIPPVDIRRYPAIKKYLDNFYEKLVHRQDQGITPYNLRNCAYMNDFSKQKITWGNLCLSPQYAFVEEEYFINAPSPMIVPGDKYILAILNSKVGDFYIRQLGVSRSGGYFEYKPMFVEKIPIPTIDNSTRSELIKLVDIILQKKYTNLEMIEDEINRIIFNIYNLTNEEIAMLD